MSRTSNADIAPWIRPWTRIASVLTGLAALYGLIAAHDLATRVLAGVIALLSLLLFRRVGSLAIGELGDWGPSSGILGWGGAFDSPRGVFSPEIQVWLTGIWLVGAIVVRTAMPSAFGPASVGRSELEVRVLGVSIVEHRYYRAHGSYSSDIATLRALYTFVIDSLVVVTVDPEGYRAVARDPGGGMSCGLWGGKASTRLRIAGVAADTPRCWTGTAEGP